MSTEKIQLQNLPIELSQFLKYCGLAETGGHAKMLVLDGLVKVNGETELKKSRKLHVGDKVEVNQSTYEISS